MPDQGAVADSIWSGDKIRMSKHSTLPKVDDLYQPTLQALAKLGGSASVEELEDAIALALGATQEQLDMTYPKSGAHVLVDRMSWARSWLKSPRFIDNPKRGVWVLTEEGRSVADKSNAELRRMTSDAYRALMAAKVGQAVEEESAPQSADPDTARWSDQLLQQVQNLEPSVFERLCQRMLRESGFTRVEVTGKSGDGGIDGAGVLRVNLISFQVLFQCKRYKGSVGSGVVRDFRGAMQGRADKGLIITTGTFTADARREATRDGAPAIDLLDGEALCILLKDLRLGVEVRPVTTEQITVDEVFFAGL